MTLKKFIKTCLFIDIYSKIQNGCNEDPMESISSYPMPSGTIHESSIDSIDIHCFSGDRKQYEDANRSITDYPSIPESLGPVKIISGSTLATGSTPEESTISQKLTDAFLEVTCNS